MPLTDPITIKVFTGSGFVEEETHASTVSEYRAEKELPDDIRISVNSKNVAAVSYTHLTLPTKRIV